MKSIRVITLALAMLAVSTPVTLLADDHERHPGMARDLVARAQSDVQKASQFTRNNEKGKERERFDNSQKSLAELDRSFSKGKYNKDRLDKAIEDIQSILDHNTLASEDRDVLRQDVTDLRAMRSYRD
jgi:hypothetical protein